MGSRGEDTLCQSEVFWLAWAPLESPDLDIKRRRQDGGQGVVRGGALTGPDCERVAAVALGRGTGRLGEGPGQERGFGGCCCKH